MRSGKILNPRGVCSPGGFALYLKVVKNENGETWCQSHLADRQLHQLLEKVDADLAEEACQEGCLYCEGKLHRADYDRNLAVVRNGSGAIAFVVLRKIA